MSNIINFEPECIKSNNVEDKKAFGCNTKACGQCSFATGQETQTNGIGSFTMGYSNTADGDYSLSKGWGTESRGLASSAEGIKLTSINNFIKSHNSQKEDIDERTGEKKTISIGLGSHAEGGGTESSGDYSHSEGAATQAVGDCSHAEGLGTKAIGVASHAEGDPTVAFGNFSHAEGRETMALGTAAHSEGWNTNAEGLYSHSEGVTTIARGNASHSEGNNTLSVGKYSHSEGFFTNATGKSSHAQNLRTIANGDNSHAEGENTEANGKNSHAQGLNTKANGDKSHSSGENTESNGELSFSHGKNAIVNGNNSMSFGDDLILSGDNSFLLSKHSLGATLNISDDNATYLESDKVILNSVSNGNIGIGTDSPTEKLEINGNIKTNGNIITNDSKIQIIRDDTVDELDFMELNYNQTGLHPANSTHWKVTLGNIENNNPNTEDLSLNLYSAGSTAFNYTKRVVLSGETGHIGIDIDKPTERLDVNGNIKTSGNIITNNFNGNGDVDFEGTNIILDKNSSGTPIKFIKMRSNNILISSVNENITSPDTIELSGNVGIGIISPTAKLDVDGEIKTNTLLRIRNEIEGPLGNECIFIRPPAIKDGDGNYIGESIIAEIENHAYPNIFNPRSVIKQDQWDLNNDNNASTRMKFCLRNNNQNTGSENEILILRSDNKVGIGIENPTEALDVDGNIKTSGNIITNNFSGNDDVNFTGTNIILDSSTSSFVKYDSGEGIQIQGDSGEQIQLRVANTRVFKDLLVEGNVGIGTSSPSDKLVVNGNIDCTGDILSSGKIRANDVVDIQITDNVLSSNTKFRTFMDWNLILPNQTADLYPSYRWDIQDISNNGTYSRASLNLLSRYDNNNSYQLVYTIDNNRNMGIGTGSPSEKLEVNGNILASGTITPSDKRIKKNIKNLDDEETLNVINKLKPKKYQYNKVYNSSDHEVYGFIAQEFKEVIDYAVKVYPEKIFKTEDYQELIDEIKNNKELTREEKIEQIKELNNNERLKLKNFHTMKKDVMFPLLVKNCQILNSKNEKLKNKNDSLEKRVDKLENDLSSLIEKINNE